MYRSILAWNKLPGQIRNIDVKDQFKKMMLDNIQDPYKKIV